MTLATACLEDKDPYTSGFIFVKPATNITPVYANNTTDSIIVYSYGKWSATTNNSTWCRLSSLSGNAGVYSVITATFEQNTTGKGRSAQINFTDTNHPDDGRAAVLYFQYATRGDGSLGSAADVKAISGSDGSRYEFSYDTQHRPLSLMITQDEAVKRKLKLTYNDTDSILTVEDGSNTLRGAYYNDYQPIRLIGGGDTITYASQYYSNYTAVSPQYAFNFEHRSATRRNIYAFLLGGQNLSPDSLHCADSLRIARITDNTSTIDKMKLEYSDKDNRHQSIDANQIIFGTDNCDPYQLLSLFRYTRNTSILKTVRNGDSGYNIYVELNADGSVHTLTVERVSGGVIIPDLPIVYTIEY